MTSTRRLDACLPERGHFVVRAGHVLTMDDGLGDLVMGDVEVRDGRIVAVGRSLAAPGAIEIPARNMIALPGFVDTHWHLWNTGLRAFVRGDDARHGYFPLTLGLGPRFTPDDSYWSVALGLCDGLASGITTVHDWSHNVLTPDHAGAELQALADFGVRGRFAWGWGQDQPLDKPMPLEALERLAASPADPDGLRSLGTALRTPVDNPRGTVPIGVVREEFAAVRAMGLPITMHARPGVVTVLDEHGLLGPDLQLVHPQGVSETERRRVAEAGTSFSCSPVIELLYAQATRGEIQFHELEAAGVRQSISVDSSSASANADFFGCLRALLWSHKQRFGSRVPLTARRLLRLATIDGARDLGLDHVTGSLTPGKRADLILVRASDANMAPVVDPTFALIYSGQPSNVDTVVVDGRIVRRAGAFTMLDEWQVVSEATTAMHALAARGGVRPADTVLTS